MLGTTPLRRYLNMQRGKKFESFCDGGCFSVIQEGLCDFAGMTGLLGGIGGGGESHLSQAPERRKASQKQSLPEPPRISKSLGGHYCRS